MQRIRLPEIVLGSFLTVAVFAAGATYNGKQGRSTKASEVAGSSQSADAALTGSTWLTKDAAGFFAFGSVLVGIGQLLLFFFQLRYMRRGMEDATRAATAAVEAAKAGAEQAKIAGRALTEFERPWIFVFGPQNASSDMNGEFFVEYTVANYGKMPAIIEGASVGFTFSGADGDPQFPLYPDEDHTLVAAPVLKAGEERKIRDYFPSSPAGNKVYKVINEGTPLESLIAVPAVEIETNQYLFFRLIIPYRGPTSLGHETRANWLYREDTLDFVRRGGPTLNSTK